MERPLAEIRQLANKHSACIIYAGDIFDRWNAAPEVINFAIDTLPFGYAIPGQHDLPNHNYDEKHRSAYHTLCSAGKIKNLAPGKSIAVNGFMWHGFPWGFDVGLVKPDGLSKSIAVIHAFIWKERSHAYPGVSEVSHLEAWQRKLHGYTTAVFGDNHKGFHAQTGTGCNVFNCGSIMRRKIDEKDHIPTVGLLYHEGSVAAHALDCSEDLFVDVTTVEERAERVLDVSEFVTELKGLHSSDHLDFENAVKRFLDNNGITGRVRDIIMQAIH